MSIYHTTFEILMIFQVQIYKKISNKEELHYFIIEKSIIWYRLPHVAFSPCCRRVSMTCWACVKKVVKVVKVKMVIFIFGFGHLLTIYKYIIFIIVEDFDTSKTILTKWPNDQMTANCKKNSPNPIFWFGIYASTKERKFSLGDCNLGLT